MWTRFKMLFIYIFPIFIQQILGEPPCDSLIYCQGELYRRVMDGNPHIYKAMLFEEETILNNFNKLLVRKNNSLSHDDLTQFVDEHFREESNDILVTQDFAMKYPTSIGNISKELLNGWNVYALKGTSGRKFPSHQYSLLSPYEFYNTNTKLEAECQYWDNYLIVNGLLASENYITAQRIIDNLVSMVKRFGMVPAANRIFYATRSNPPLLVPMAYNFYKATNKKSWLNRTIAFLEKELMFWVENRAVNVPVDETVYTLYRYYSKCTEPRPELYKLDIAFGEIVLNKKRLYQELNTLTETGWGLSKRWLFSTIDYGEDADDLRQIQPSRVIPVDLNAFLYKSFKCLSFLHKSIKNEDKHILWKREAKKLLDAMSVVLWHEDELTWYDYDFFLNTPRYTFFISNLMPIWAKAYNRQKSTDILDKSYKLLQENYPDFTLIEQMPESIMDLGFSIGNPTLIPKLHVFILEGFQESGYVKAKKYFGNMFAEWLNNKMYEWIEPAYGTEHIAIDQKIDENRLNPLVASYVKVMQYYFDEAKMWGKKYEISISSRASYISPSVISMLYYFIITII